MSYIITNNYTNLKLVLSTTHSNYNLIRLNTYINDSTNVFKTYTPSIVTNSSGGHDLTFIIHTKDYTIDDIITKFELKLAGNIHLWNTNEGITWLLDGKEVDTTHTNTKTFTFEEQGNHVIQAVFTGNDSLETSKTSKTPFIIVQPEINESGSLDNNGKYKIQFVNNKLSTLTYDDNTKIEFILTKGGVPVTTGQRNIEIITPKTIVSHTLNSKGKASVKNNNWDAGTYTIGAFYQDENRHTITRAKKKITIQKGTPIFKDNFSSAGSFIPNSQYKAVLKFNGDPIANTKLTMYVNSKAHTVTTDKTGAVYLQFKKTGTFNIKTIFKGSKNLNKVELTRTITVVKANG